MDNYSVDTTHIYLRSIRALHYKSFPDAYIELTGPSGLTFIVGPNNAGKSQLARSLQCLTKSPSEGSVALEWAVPQLPAKKETSSIEYFDHLICGLGYVNSASGTALYAIVDDGTQLPAGVNGVQGEQAPSGRWWIPIQDKTEHRRERKGFLVQPGGGNGVVAPTITKQTIDELEGAIGKLRHEPYMLPVVRGASEESIAVNATRDLAPDGSNLPNVLLWLSTHRTASFTRVKAALNAISPGLAELQTPVTESSVQLAFTDETRPETRSLQELGSGIEQALLVTLACETQLDRSIVVLDEPEIGLHPRAQHELCSHLRYWAQDRQIIVVTQSASLLESRQKDEPLYLVSQPDGVSEVQRADDSLPVVLDILGVSPADAFGARRVLIVEGKSDILILHSLFPALRETRWIAVVRADGSSRVRPIKESIEEIVHLDSQNVWAILDADDAPHVQNEDRIHILGRREVENLFLDFPGAIASALQLTCTVQLEANDIAEAIYSAAVGLKEETVWLRTRARLMSGVNTRTIRLQRPKDGDVAPTLEAVHELVDQAKESYPSTDTINATWEEEARSVESDWQSSWQRLVPGSKVLESVWKQYGGRYKKMRDGPRVAEFIQDDVESWPAQGDLADLATFISGVVTK